MLVGIFLLIYKFTLNINKNIIEFSFIIISERSLF
jgi:hypothetical protein